MNSVSYFILTQSNTAIIGTIAKIFGIIMNGIYNFFYNNFGIVSIGVSIIVFTLIVRLLMLPLAIKQQQSMKEVQKVQPELKKIQEKYKNAKDPESQRKMQAEQAKLYQDYNINPFGGCLPLLIQMPILFSLFAVLRNIPAYIHHVKDIYIEVVGKISTVSGFENIIDTFHSAQPIKIKGFDIGIQDKIIDLLSSLSSKGWLELKELFPTIGNQLNPLVDKIADINYFLTINLADKPVSFSNGISGIFTLGLLIPILCFIAQILVTKTASSNASANNPQDQSQKTMMYTMPFVTLLFVFQMPAGLGLYWLTSNFFQVAQQIVVDRHLKDKN